MSTIDQKRSLISYCKEHGISVSNNMTIDAIVKKITEAENSRKKLQEDNFYYHDARTNKSNQLYREANRLVRCIVNCTNPNKSYLKGEIFCVGNSTIPEIKKFIQYNVPYHVPQAILNVLKDKTYTAFRKNKNGTSAEAYQTKEYVIEYLPPLTQEEYEAIQQRQLADPIESD